MRATDIIRDLLSLIDTIDTTQSQETESNTTTIEIGGTAGDEPRRCKQIFDILAAEKEQQYSNSPAEVIAGINSVTVDAGGGLNGPKHPHDIRVKDPSAYPNQQEY